MFDYFVVISENDLDQVLMVVYTDSKEDALDFYYYEMRGEPDEYHEHYTPNKISVVNLIVFPYERRLAMVKRNYSKHMEILKEWEKLHATV